MAAATTKSVVGRPGRPRCSAMKSAIAAAPNSSDGRWVAGSDTITCPMRSKKLPETPAMPNSFGNWVDAI
jgi:hypothetical protein